VNGNVKLGRAAARSGEWAQHFLNASCFLQCGPQCSLQTCRVSVAQNSQGCQTLERPCFKAAEGVELCVAVIFFRDTQATFTTQ